ncbi:MAG: Gfo/Idh/MocA family oxidoreductase [Planctomycetes bacterium]|nr:Gfo/Idh/MocA family oxidoreductase [Planctomycetota bacterium]
MSEQTTVGLVGPGRARNGLGPFVAGFLEECGMRVVAGVGRDVARTRAACEALGERLGHVVEPFVDLDAMLDRRAPGLLAIHAPVEAHLPALRAACAHGLDVLCDKPLVRAAECAEVDGVLAQLAERGRVVLETCQWPEVLGAFDRLWPAVRRGAPGEIALGLSPSGRGRAMVEDSLSHLLSLAQACSGDAAPALRSARAEGLAPGASATVVHVELETAGRALDLRLELRHVATQPRPAWLAIDGRRMDRFIDTRAGRYAMGFENAAGKRVAVDDPLRALVYRLPALIRERDGDAARRESERIRGRAGLYAAILDRLGAGGHGGECA